MIVFGFNTILIKFEFSVNSNLLTSQISNCVIYMMLITLPKVTHSELILSLIPLYNTNETNPPSMHSREGTNFLKYISKG